MAVPKYRIVRIGELVNATGGGQMNTLAIVGDLTGNGRGDVVVSGRNGTMGWFENTGEPSRDGGWPFHKIDDVTNQETGGLIRDLTGNGLGDIINGNDASADEMSWWENPGDPHKTWKRRMIVKTGKTQMHDTAIGLPKDDGVEYLVFTNQKGEGGTSVYCVPIPADPRVSPWPYLEEITAAKSVPHPAGGGRTQPEEGLAIGDVDGDGKNEVVCGTHWYKWENDRWTEHQFAEGYMTTKCAIAGIDGDGENEIVLAEGDPCAYGVAEGGKLAWFKPAADPAGMWNEHRLAEGLLDAHTLHIGDFCGNGRADILYAEIGMPEPGNREAHGVRAPETAILENDGSGTFTKHVIDRGRGLHEGVLYDIDGRGTPDLIGKPLHGPERWAIHVYYRE